MRYHARVGIRLLAWILLVLLCVPAGLAEEVAPAAVVPSEYHHPEVPTPDVPACERVEDAYFSGAVLVGDSLADGLGIHNLLPELQLMSRIGLTPYSARTSAVFKQDGKPVTIVQKLPYMRPTAVYLWLGSNSLMGTGEDQVIYEYERLLRLLVKALPNTPFYLLEATPVTQEAKCTNERIDAFNRSLYALAKKYNVYLLPTNSLLKGQDGCIVAEYGAEDGVHLKAAAYELLAEYLYTHALPVIEVQEEEPLE